MTQTTYAASDTASDPRIDRGPNRFVIDDGLARP